MYFACAQSCSAGSVCSVVVWGTLGLKNTLLILGFCWKKQLKYGHEEAGKNNVFRQCFFNMICHAVMDCVCTTMWPKPDKNWFHLPIGGMGTSYNLPKTPEDFLCNMEEMDIHDGGTFFASLTNPYMDQVSGFSDKDSERSWLIGCRLCIGKELSAVGNDKRLWLF